MDSVPINETRKENPLTTSRSASFVERQRQIRELLSTKPPEPSIFPVSSEDIELKVSIMELEAELQDAVDNFQFEKAALINTRIEKLITSFIDKDAFSQSDSLVEKPKSEYDIQTKNEEMYSKTTHSGQSPDIQRPYITVLGIAQDAGVPQLGCTRGCCRDAFADPSKILHATSIAVVDPHSGERWIFDASPDIRYQLVLLEQVTSFMNDRCSEKRSLIVNSRTKNRKSSSENLENSKSSYLPVVKNSSFVTGFFLTHAHIGHYTGLMFFGKESANVSKLQVYAAPRMKTFLQTNGPWSQLKNNIDIKPLINDTSTATKSKTTIIKPADTIITETNKTNKTNKIDITETNKTNKIDTNDCTQATPMRVGDRAQRLLPAIYICEGRVRVIPLWGIPHRDEYSETVGYIIEAVDSKRKVVFIPDIDAWKQWKSCPGGNLLTFLSDPNIVAAYIDGTFFDDNELSSKNNTDSIEGKKQIRDLSEIPHPRIAKTLKLLKDFTPTQDHRSIRFIHLNHTNPALQMNSKEKKIILENGFDTASEGEVIIL